MNDSTSGDEPVLTRSEERLQVTTRPAGVGRAVLRRIVVTEERTITVQVSHEEVRFDIVPFDAPVPVGEVGQGAHLALPEFVLHQEEVVVTKRIVPVERVRLHLEQITERRDVTEALRKEQITFDDGTTPRSKDPSSPDLDR